MKNTSWLPVRFATFMLLIAAPLANLSAQQNDDSIAIHQLVQAYYVAVQNEDVDTLTALHVFQDQRDKEQKTRAIQQLFANTDTDVAELDILKVSIHPSLTMATAFVYAKAQISNTEKTDRFEMEENLVFVLQKASGRWSLLRLMPFDQYSKAVQFDQLVQESRQLLDEPEDQSTVVTHQRPEEAPTVEPTVQQPGGTKVISTDQMGFADVDVSMSMTNNWENANWGSAVVMSTACQSDGTSTRKVFIRLDDSKLDLAQAEIARAELEFDTTFGSGSGGIEVYRVVEPWNAGVGVHSEGMEPGAAPGDITWHQQPALDEGRIWARAEVSPSPGRIRFDITELLRAWLSGLHPNHGMALIAKAQGEEFYYRTLVSSDHPDASTRPRLHIELGAGVAEGQMPGEAINTDPDQVPEFDFVLMPSEPREGDPIVLVNRCASPIGEEVIYLWHVDGEHVRERDNQMSWELVGLSAGIHTIQLEVRGASCGNGTINRMIEVH